MADNITEIAKDFVALCQSGDLDAAGAKYWADDVVSIGDAPGRDEVVENDRFGFVDCELGTFHKVREVRVKEWR